MTQLKYEKLDNKNMHYRGAREAKYWGRVYLTNLIKILERILRYKLL